MLLIIALEHTLHKIHIVLYLHWFAEWGLGQFRTLFFIFLYPAFNQDGSLERLEFLVFFVPYGFALVLETFFLVKLLNTV